MPAVFAAVRGWSSWCLRPFKVAARPLLRSMVRKLSERFADDIAPLAEICSRLDAIETRQARLEAFRWDHVALSRRLAAIEDHVEKLSRRQVSLDPSREPTAPPTVVPFAPADAHRAAGAEGGSASRRRA
ncbi:MAG TPA: hypothetical protein VMV69_20990 [Pirellulales bacterium]|nr:hypothetical protein [Pirellulales bacterium]